MPNLLQIKSILPELIKSAQNEYDIWSEDEDAIDEYAGGGICHLIADAFCSVLCDNDIECSSVSSSHEQHVYTIIQINEGIYSLDINPYRYENGAGYSWTKIPGVVFDVSDIELFKLSDDPSEFDHYTDEW